MTMKLLSTPSSEFTFGLAETRAELAAIRRFRKATYQDRSGLVINDSIDLDRRSLVFALYRTRRPVATLRLLPLPDAAATITDFADSVVDPTFGAAVELGRLAVDADESPAILLTLVERSAVWLTENSEHKDYVSYCAHKLVFGYELFGAVDRGVDVVHPDNGRAYRILKGTFHDALPKSDPAMVPAAA